VAYHYFFLPIHSRFPPLPLFLLFPFRVSQVVILSNRSHGQLRMLMSVIEFHLVSILGIDQLEKIFCSSFRLVITIPVPRPGGYLSSYPQSCRAPLSLVVYRAADDGSQAQSTHP
jgi:hypothetical protein